MVGAWPCRVPSIVGCLALWGENSAARTRAGHHDQAKAGLQPSGAVPARRQPGRWPVRQARPTPGDTGGGTGRRRESDRGACE